MVLLFSFVGFGRVFQQIPLSVTGEPPFEEILPPEFTEFEVILDKADVDITGITLLFSISSSRDSSLLQLVVKEMNIPKINLMERKVKQAS